ncbi:MAG: prolipoprotein diacylglyceryl transferase [Propionibacteriaceae bacterium]
MTFTIPVPPFSGFSLGPLTIHMYAICIIIGIFSALWLVRKRFVSRGGKDEHLDTVTIWTIFFGIIGARLYHVITDYQLYFGAGRHPIEALKIWNGGLGIWGAIALGAVGVFVASRRKGLRFWALLDVLAPGALLAQGIGRVGNWFNQELYGRPLNSWWALTIDADHRLPQYADIATYHPTFAYEMLWNLAGVALLLVLDRRFRLRHGQMFWGYVLVYTMGRTWIEHLRIDTVNRIGGFRLNEYTSWIILTVSICVFLWLTWRKPGSDDLLYEEKFNATDEATVDHDDSAVVSGDEDVLDIPST